MCNSKLSISELSPSGDMPGILWLSPEVLIEIFSYLSYADLISLRRTCTLWKTLCKDELLTAGIVTRFAHHWEKEVIPNISPNWIAAPGGAFEVIWPSADTIRSAAALTREALFPKKKLKPIFSRLVAINKFGTSESSPDCAELTCAAAIIEAGFSLKIDSLRLESVTMVTASSLRTLVHRARKGLLIANMRECEQWADSINCRELDLTFLDVSGKFAEIILEKLELAIQQLHIGPNVDFCVDTFTKYSGEGACERITLSGNALEKYWEPTESDPPLRKWVHNKKWNVTLLPQSQTVFLTKRRAHQRVTEACVFGARACNHNTNCSHHRRIRCNKGYYYLG